VADNVAIWRNCDRLHSFGGGALAHVSGNVLLRVVGGREQLRRGTFRKLLAHNKSRDLRTRRPTGLDTEAAFFENSMRATIASIEANCRGQTRS